MKDSIKKITENLTKPIKTVSFRDEPVAEKMRLAVVAYRDFCDTIRIEKHEFNEKIEDFDKFLGNLKATGGGDGPEDVFGGIDAALNLSWDPQCGTKVIFHIADAPCHGTDFHNWSSGK